MVYDNNLHKNMSNQYASLTKNMGFKYLYRLNLGMGGLKSVWSLKYDFAIICIN